MSVGHNNKKPRLFYTPCDSHQSAALIYTNRLYSKDDPERCLPRWKRWLKLRDKWMKKQEHIHGQGNLSCSICGKKSLDPWGKNNRPTSATIDHILPVSKYPHLWNVETNFQVACSPCNKKKANHVY